MMASSLSAGPQMYTISVELNKVDPDLSLSQYLSFMTEDGWPPPFKITQNGKPLDSLYLVVLAINEEARHVGYGAVYFLPVVRPVGYKRPCDLLYVAEDWTAAVNTRWDELNWADRLEMWNAVKNPKLSSTVLPICVRVLSLEVAETVEDDTSEKSSYYRPQAAFSLQTASNTDPAMAEVAPSPRISIDAIKMSLQEPEILSYTRPIEDMSTLLLLFPRTTSEPILVTTTAIEHPCISRREPTPNQLSETITIGRPITASFHSKYSALSSPKDRRTMISNVTRLVRNSSCDSVRDIIQSLNSVFLADKYYHRVAPHHVDWIGRLTRTWQEVAEVMEGKWALNQGLPTGWPTTQSVGTTEAEAKAEQGQEERDMFKLADRKYLRDII